MTFFLITVMVLAYLVGSLSAAIITSKLMGLPDTRTYGSHNPGATNIYQYVGKNAAILTLLGDLLKGLIVVSLVKFTVDNDVVTAFSGVAVFLGHLYPLYFDFRGGKGVATAFGVVIGVDIAVALVLLGTWLLVYKASKLSSLSALTSAFLLPIYLYFFVESEAYVVMGVFLSMMLFVRHRSNILKILDGTED